MAKKQTHKPYCFAGQPAPCAGYFQNDVLPCVCGATGTLLEALNKLTIPGTPIPKNAPGQPHVLPLSA